MRTMSDPKNSRRRRADTPKLKNSIRRTTVTEDYPTPFQHP